jgi:1-acyl-sn-glycerol-3-phosphate acyltransferase
MHSPSDFIHRSLRYRDPKTIASLMPKFAWVYQHYFQVRTEGWEKIPTQDPILFVGSHNGGLASPDLPMFMYDWFRRFGYDRPIYGLMHRKVWHFNREVARLAEQMGALPAEPWSALAALQAGASVLVYPGGAQDVFRPYSDRHRINLAGRKGFIKLALRQGVPIVPLVSQGAHETFIVLTDCYEQARQLHDRGLLPWYLDIDPEVMPLYLGLPWGIALGPLPHFPWPVPMKTKVCDPIRFDRSGREAAQDPVYVDRCYEQVVTEMQAALDTLVTRV